MLQNVVIAEEEQMKWCICRWT